MLVTENACTCAVAGGQRVQEAAPASDDGSVLDADLKSSPGKSIPSHPPATTTMNIARKIGQS